MKKQIQLIQDLDKKTKQLIKYSHINEVFFIVLVVLCFIGDLLADISGRAAIFYWLLMIPVFFSITLINEKAKEYKKGLSIPHFYQYNFLYWLSALMATLLILFLYHADNLNAHTSALAIHIIVAHTLFLLGALAGLRFYLIGLFLFLTAGITTQFEGLVGITILLAVPVLLVGFYYESHKQIPIKTDDGSSP